MKNVPFTLACFTTLVLFACSAEPSKQENSPNVVPQSQLDALEKAKDVEQSLQEAVDAREKDMRERGT